MNWHMLNLYGVALSLWAMLRDPIPMGAHHIRVWKRGQQKRVWEVLDEQVFAG